ncbi:unnamed protein product, partial [Polarella glacialis]
ARCCDDSEPVAAEESEADAGREMLEAKAADESTAGDSIRWGVLRRKGRPGADDSATSISQMHRRKLGVNHVVSVAAMGLTLIDPEDLLRPHAAYRAARGLGRRALGGLRSGRGLGCGSKGGPRASDASALAHRTACWSPLHVRA